MPKLNIPSMCSAQLPSLRYVIKLLFFSATASQRIFWVLKRLLSRVMPSPSTHSNASPMLPWFSPSSSFAHGREKGFSVLQTETDRSPVSPTCIEHTFNFTFFIITIIIHNSSTNICNLIEITRLYHRSGGGMKNGGGWSWAKRQMSSKQESLICGYLGVREANTKAQLIQDLGIFSETV